MKFRTLIEQMSLEDKIALCSGADFFNTRSFEKYGIPSIMMTDGPHGLRKQLESVDHLGVANSIPATCFPTASLTACSWDRALLREMGVAIAEEALQEGVSIVLGPGVNIKRNPLCGRNFEYFSEDPYLSGEMAAAWIEGLQSLDVGASLKHFAANNQESERMASDSIIDERALRELYLPAFEKAVKSAQPATVMCAYNKLNGVYCSDHRYLLRDILRDAWGFKGVIVTDWGAMHDRVKAFDAGLDLEMPASQGYFDESVMAAVRQGELLEEHINVSVDRLLDLIFTSATKHQPGYRYNAESHHMLAKTIAANSAVLLKNEGNMLPIKKGTKIALMGALAKTLRYQGAGSSHINPTKLTSLTDGFDEIGLGYTYFEGYSLQGAGDDVLLIEAVAGARTCDVAVIVAGLPEEAESEGFDRNTLAMPDSHNRLIAEVAEANPNTVVVLVGGAPVEMPWLQNVKGILHMYLSGQAGGLAAAELLMGIVNPSGKLAESYPLSYADVPSAGFYEDGGKQAQYREGLYVGYRYYDKAQKEVLFPFGHGLSYTTFAYSDLTIIPVNLTSSYELDICFSITNTGDVDGAEIVQVYVGAIGSSIYRPEKELKEFTKVWLKPGETQRVSLHLASRSFAIYDVKSGDWVIPNGRYRISVGRSSQDIRLQEDIKVNGQEVLPLSEHVSEWYHHPSRPVTQADFESLLGRKIEPVKPWRRGEYTLECTFKDMKASLIIRQIVKGIGKAIAKGFGGVDYQNPTFKMMMESATSTPLKNLGQLSPDSMPKHVIQGIVHLANGKYIQGILSFILKPNEEKAQTLS